jgi:hypothetical protein
MAQCQVRDTAQNASSRTRKVHSLLHTDLNQGQAFPHLYTCANCRNPHLDKRLTKGIVDHSLDKAQPKIIPIVLDGEANSWGKEIVHTAVTS